MGGATATTAPFVGRARELRAATEGLDAVVGQNAPLLVVTGEPGIGKTRVLAELGDLAGRRGFSVFRGSATELEHSVPFGVVVDALDRELSARGTAQLHGLTAEQRGFLADVFPALSGLRATRPVDLIAERYRAHHAIRVLLERLADGAPLVLLLDDVHWADDASLELIAHLARRPPAAPVLVAIAMRTAQAPPKLDIALDGAAREGRARRLLIEPLAESEAGVLLGTGFSADRRAALLRECGGNPFYLLHLARLRDRIGSAVPPTVVRAVQRELAGLPEQTRRIAAAAAVAGDTFEPDFVAATAGVDDATAALDTLAALDIVRSGEQGLLRFRHPIVRRAVYDDAPAAWLVGAHGRAARALAERHAPAPLRAHHEERSARPGDEHAIAVLDEAAAATVRLAPGSAAGWLAAALRLLPESDERRRGLLFRQAGALMAAGRLAEAGAVFETILTTIPAFEGRARVIAALSLIEHMVGRRERAATILAEGLAALAPDAPERALLEHELALNHWIGNDCSGALEAAKRAERVARHGEDSVLVALTLGLRAVAEHGLGQVAAARRHAEQAAGMVDTAADRALSRHIWLSFWVGMALLDVDRFEDAAAELERGLAVARATRREAALVPMRMASAFALTPLGRLDEAGEHAGAALEIARLSGAPKLMALATTGTTLVALRRGDLTTALAAGAEGMAAAGDGVGAPRAPLGAAWYAEALIDAGKPDQAREALFGIAGGPDLPLMEVPHRPLGYEALTRAAVASGDVFAARDWADRAAAIAAPLALGSATAAACRARAHAYDDADAARRAADHAGPLDAARAWLLAGRLSGDVELLQRAHDQLGVFGARRARDEAASEVRALGRRVARHAHRPASSGVLATLSPREIEVAALVHDRLTNREIAERLVLSEKTIENHLARIFAKLQIRSRVDLARAYERPRLGESPP